MSVLVYTENWDGKFKKLSYEIVSFAAAIAKEMNTTVTALSIGHVAGDELKSLGKYGANKILDVRTTVLSRSTTKRWPKQWPKPPKLKMQTL